jgi:hypothetical protein
MLNIYILDDLSTFEYIEIMMIVWYGWELCKLWLHRNMNMILVWV